MVWSCDCSSLNGWTTYSDTTGYNFETDGTSFLMTEIELKPWDNYYYNYPYAYGKYEIPVSGDFDIIANVTIPEFTNADSSTQVSFDFLAAFDGKVYSSDGTKYNTSIDFYFEKLGLNSPIIYLYGFQTSTTGMTLTLPFTGNLRIVRTGSSLTAYVGEQILWQSTYNNTALSVTGIEIDYYKESEDNLPIYLPSVRVNDISITGNLVSANSRLKTITSSIFGATLSPTMVAGTYAYTMQAGYNCSSGTFTITPESSTSTMTINGIAIQSGVASPSFDLAYGDNVFTINVLAQDGIGTSTYTLTVNRYTTPSTICTLSAMSITSDITSLTPTFSATTYSYSTKEYYYTTAKNIKVTATNKYSTITVNGTIHASGTTLSYPLNNVGDNIFLIVVTAEDGVSQKTYTVNLVRNPSPSTVCTLSNFYTYSGALTPTFNSSVYEYTHSIPWSADSEYRTFYTPTTFKGATVTVNGAACVSKNFSGWFNGGDTVFFVEVTAEDRVTKQTYKLTVSKVLNPSTVCTLSALTSTVTFTPTFDSNITEYSTSSDFNVMVTNMTATVTDSNSTLTLDGVALTSGITRQVNIDVGDSSHVIVVTAQDGITTKIYTFNFYRKPSEAGTYYINIPRYNNEPYVDTDAISTNYYLGDWSKSYLCELPNGQLLLSYRENEHLKWKLSIVNSFNDLLTKKNIAGVTEYDFTVDYPSLTYLLPFVAAFDGEVYLFKVLVFSASVGVPCQIDLYKNSNKGLSQTWTHQGQMYYKTCAATTTSGMHVPELFVEDNGSTIALFFNGVLDDETYGGQSNIMCLSSLDGGHSWNTSLVFNDTSLANSCIYHNFKTMIKIGNTYIFETNAFGYFWDRIVTFHSTTDFSTWSQVNYVSGNNWTFQGATLDAPNNYMWRVNDTLYMLDLNILYRRTYSDITSLSDLMTYEKWTNVSTNVYISHDDYDYRPYISKDKSTFVLLEQTNYDTGSCLRVQGYVGKPVVPFYKHPMYRFNNVNCISLDGSTTYIDCGYSSLYTTPSITLEAWFKFKGTTGKYQNIIFNYTEHHDCFLITDSIGTPIFRLSKMQTDNLTGTPLIVGNTYHIVASASYTSMYLYINGVLVDSKSLVYSPRITNTANFYVGSNGVGSQYLNADLYLAAIYNDCWDEAFVTDRYANLSQDIVPANCAMYYDCRTVTNPIIDKSGNGNDGILYGITCDRERVRNMKHYSISFINDRTLKYKNSNESWGGVLL